MWLGSDLIGVVLPSETPSVKLDKNSIEPNPKATTGFPSQG